MQRLPVQPLLNEVSRRACDGFTLVESAYRPGARMARHGHGPARLSIVLRGSYTEQYGRKTRHTAPLTVVLHPPHEAHAVEFDQRGAHILGVELEPDWLARLRAAAPVLEHPADFRGGPPAWLALRLYGEFRAPDALAPLAHFARDEFEVTFIPGQIGSLSFQVNKEPGVCGFKLGDQTFSRVK